MQKIKTECDMETKACFLCQIPCSNVCPHCRLVYYCSEDHFKLHRVTLNSDDQVIKRRIINTVNNSLYKSHYPCISFVFQLQIFRMVPMMMIKRMVLVIVSHMKPQTKKESVEYWLQRVSSISQKFKKRL